MDKGAHFYKCDFQVHTPHDANWHGTEAATPAEHKAYADELIQACRTKGLGGIVIERNKAWHINDKATYDWEKCEHGNWSDWEPLLFKE